MTTFASHAWRRVRTRWWIASLLGVVVFSPSLWSGYLADDFVMLHTIRVLHLPLQAFTHTDIATLRNHPYRPLWILYNAIINWIWTSPVAHHVASIMLYAVAIALVVIIARRFVDSTAALVAGVVFALYPRHAEAVAWIAGSTDVTAGFLVLVAMTALTVRRAPRWAMVVAVAAGVCAPLAKESGFVVPALAAVLVAFLWSNEAGDVRRRRAITTVVIAVGVVGDLVIRTMVLHGMGNDVTELFGLKRLVVVIASQLVATLTSSQLLVLVHHWMLVVPVVLGALLLYGAWRTWRSDDDSRRRLLLVGGGWFVLSLVPIYNNAVALNNSNGERLLFLPSIGVALMVGAVAAPLLKIGWGRWAMGICAGVFALACVAASIDYVRAGSVRDRVLMQVSAFAKSNSTLVLLNIPDSYHASRLLGAGFAEMLARSGRPDVTLLACAPSIVDSTQPQMITFTKQPDGTLLAQSDAALPFEVPQSGRGIQTTGCFYQPAKIGHLAPGLTSAVSIRLAKTPPNTQFLWFDGVNFHSQSEIAGVI